MTASSRTKIITHLATNIKQVDSLRERVYRHLNDCMINNRLQPGEFIDPERICQELNVSRAPLREALIRLQAEGFVTILPRRGVYITPITVDFIKSAYQIIGSMEADCLNEVFHLLTDEYCDLFDASNARQRELLQQADYEAYNDENLRFHTLFMSLSENILLNKVIEPLRRRLYDFPRRSYSVEWETQNIGEHQRFIDSVRKGNRAAAVSIFRFEHWNFAMHSKYFDTYLLHD